MEDTTQVHAPTKNVHTRSIAFTSPTKPITKSSGRITGKPWKRKEFQAMQPNLSPCPGEQVQSQVTNRPGTKGLAGVVDNTLIQFVRL